jgi:tRNA pseudouridine55 synthase
VTGLGTSPGILLVDKPMGITSHDVVSRTRRAAGTRKVGHAGTLDPMATGLLILGLNAATRLLTFMVGLDKEYVATIKLGVATTTDDAEGEVVRATSTRSVTDASIAEGVAKLTGTISQVPSSVSAIKVDGKRAYALVRAGESVELSAREVTVSAFEVLGRRGDEVDVRVECSSGTYIRALARDLGADLGVGAHLTALRRTRIGPFTLGNAIGVEDMDVAAAMIAPAEAASALFASVALDEQQTIDLGHGKRFSVAAADGSPIAALAPNGRLIGLVSIDNGRLSPIVNFPTDETTA